MDNTIYHKKGFFVYAAIVLVTAVLLLLCWIYFVGPSIAYKNYQKAPLPTLCNVCSAKAYIDGEVLMREVTLNDSEVVVIEKLAASQPEDVAYSVYRVRISESEKETIGKFVKELGDPIKANDVYCESPVMEFEPIINSIIDGSQHEDVKVITEDTYKALLNMDAENRIILIVGL